MAVVNIISYIKSLAPSTRDTLYSSPWTCQAVLRSLQPLAKQYALKLLWIEQPMARGGLPEPHECIHACWAWDIGAWHLFLLSPLHNTIFPHSRAHRSLDQRQEGVRRTAPKRHSQLGGPGPVSGAESVSALPFLSLTHTHAYVILIHTREHCCLPPCREDGSAGYLLHPMFQKQLRWSLAGG
jgi:hypothetical protein